MTPNKNNQINIVRQRFSGVVVSDKMKDTVVVEVKRFEKHSRYHKFINRKTRFMVHNPDNVKKIGDSVVIESCRPISKHKSFIIVK